MQEKEIIKICKKLYEKNFLAASDGNVSLKSEDETIYITPSGVPKYSLKENEICSLDKTGHPIKGQASSEKMMHLTIYQNQLQARAVVHAHPPYSIALSLARPKWKELPLALPEIVIALGHVPFVKYVQPGTQEMGEVLIPYLKKSQALILAHHGACTWGKNLEEAYLKMEWLEHACKIIFLAENLGGANTLPKKEIEKLQSKV